MLKAVKRMASLKKSYSITKTSRRTFSWSIVSRRIQPIAVLGMIILLVGCTLLLPDPGTSNANLLLGNPTSATTSTLNPTNYLISRPQYALSYNRDKGIANWVSWQLNPNWLGNLPRRDFESDPDLPEGWYRVTSQDYTGSGFDRGHLTPAADRNRTSADSRAVFYMTNIFPQAPDNNRGPWEQLESECRAWVRQGKELYIIAGGAGSGGVGERGKRMAIARNKIAVPASTWKIVVVLDRPGSGIETITTATRVVTVLMPNQQGIKTKNWQDFRTSVDTVEAITGYDFLSNVPKPIQDFLEMQVDKR
jgi:endonuclease G, mitochondrial